MEAQLHSHAQLLEILAFSFAGGPSFGDAVRKHPAAQLIERVLLGRYLKSSDSMELALRRAVRIVCPGDCHGSPGADQFRCRRGVKVHSGT
eukprot:4362411-Lingulodinium_polyedra.AAC.1